MQGSGVQGSGVKRLRDQEVSPAFHHLYAVTGYDGLRSCALMLLRPLSNHNSVISEPQKNRPGRLVSRPAD